MKTIPEIKKIPFAVNGHTFHMIELAPGSFMMGDDGSGYDDEKPAHLVTFDKPFYMGEFPVTQALWKAVMGEDNNPSWFLGNSRPVEQVSWNDINDEFLPKLRELTEIEEFRLPSEAEWEYAARGGIHWEANFKYSGSNDVGEAAWYEDNSHRETKPVGLLKPNQLGIHDMSGNVYEWCGDYWHSNYDHAPQDGSAWDDKEDSAFRVMRGGSWFDGSQFCRVAFRGFNHPSRRHYDIGFRLVLSQ